MQNIVHCSPCSRTQHPIQLFSASHNSLPIRGRAINCLYPLCLSHSSILYLPVGSDPFPPQDTYIITHRVKVQCSWLLRPISILGRAFFFFKAWQSIMFYEIDKYAMWRDKRIHAHNIRSANIRNTVSTYWRNQSVESKFEECNSKSLQNNTAGVGLFSGRFWDRCRIVLLLTANAIQPEFPSLFWIFSLGQRILLTLFPPPPPSRERYLDAKKSLPVPYRPFSGVFSMILYLICSCVVCSLFGAQPKLELIAIRNGVAAVNSLNHFWLRLSPDGQISSFAL